MFGWIVVASALLGWDGSRETGISVDADRLEVNHIYSSDLGAKPPVKIHFTQYIWYDYSTEEQTFVVVGWLMADDASEPYRARGRWVVRWISFGMLYTVRATGRSETWTSDDPEQIDKRRYGTKYRQWDRNHGPQETP